MQIESKKDLVFKNNLYRLVLVSFVTVAIWIGFEIYWTYQKKTPEPQIKQQIEPLNPNLDTQLLDSLSARRQITLSELQAFQKAGPVIVVDDDSSPPPPTFSPIASESSQLSTYPPATSSGTLLPAEY